MHKNENPASVVLDHRIHGQRPPHRSHHGNGQCRKIGPDTVFQTLAGAALCAAGLSMLHAMTKTFNKGMETTTFAVYALLNRHPE